MQAVCRWMLTLCSGCILFGVVEDLLPRRGVLPVIKAVAALYIVLLLLSPSSIRGGLPALPEAPSWSAPTAAEADDALLRAGEPVLYRRLCAALEEAGIPARLVEVRLAGGGGSPVEVTLRLQAPEGCREEAAALCDSLLEVKAAYEWEDT